MRRLILYSEVTESFIKTQSLVANGISSTWYIFDSTLKFYELLSKISAMIFSKPSKPTKTNTLATKDTIVITARLVTKEIRYPKGITFSIQKHPFSVMLLPTTFGFCRHEQTEYEKN